MTKQKLSDKEWWEKTVKTQLKPLIDVKIIKGNWQKGYTGTYEITHAIAERMARWETENNANYSKSIRKNTNASRLQGDLLKIIFEVFDTLKVRENLDPAKLQDYAFSFAFVCFTSVADFNEDVIKDTNLPKSFGRPRATKWGKYFSKFAKSLPN